MKYVTHSSGWFRTSMTFGRSVSQTCMMSVIHLVAGILSSLRVCCRKSFTWFSRSFWTRFERKFCFLRNSIICVVWNSNRNRIKVGKSFSQVSRTLKLEEDLIKSKSEVVETWEKLFPIIMRLRLEFQKNAYYGVPQEEKLPFKMSPKVSTQARKGLPTANSQARKCASY